MNVLFGIIFAAIAVLVAYGTFLSVIDAVETHRQTRRMREFFNDPSRMYYVRKTTIERMENDDDSH